MQSSHASASESKEALHEAEQSIDSHFAQLKAREAQLRLLDQQLNARKAELVQRVGDKVKTQRRHPSPLPSCPVASVPPTPLTVHGLSFPSPCRRPATAG